MPSTVVHRPAAMPPALPCRCQRQSSAEGHWCFHEGSVESKVQGGCQSSSQL